jgi:hypothetical protein
VPRKITHFEIIRNQDGDPQVRMSLWRRYWGNSKSFVIFLLKLLSCLLIIRSVVFTYWQIRFLINDTAGFYTCLHFDQAEFQKHLLTSCFRVWLVTNWLFPNKIRKYLKSDKYWSMVWRFAMAANFSYFVQ